MKKLLTLAVAASALLFACGPSEEELAAKEKAKQDSIRIADSLAAAEAAAQAAEKARQDSIAAAEAAKEKARQDSIRTADSLANLKKGSKPKKPKTESKPETPKVGGKRPGAN
jgi:hypothetical protein